MTDDHGKTPTHRQIDENLRKVYDEVLKDDVPERFKKLLDDLRKRAKGTS